MATPTPQRAPEDTGASRGVTRRQPLARAARRARLAYTEDFRAGYGRRGKPGALSYVNQRGQRIRDARTIARIRGLVIPPAWTEVWINPAARGHLQATGRDVRGRKQYIYHPDWRTTRDAAKYSHLVEFAASLPRLRRAVRASLRRPHLDRERVTAVVVRLLETSLIRIGNDEYARTNQSYGLTTLRLRHAQVGRRRIRFSFRGKSGMRHQVDIVNPPLARTVRRLQDLPGQELFCFLDAEGKCRRLRSDDVNSYLRTHMGTAFTAKDFRTWAGTVLAALTLAQFPPPGSKTEARRLFTAAVRSVASRLGNTPAIARRSYIHPAVFEAFVTGDLPPLPDPETWPPPAHRVRLTPAERAVLRILRSAGAVSTS